MARKRLCDTHYRKHLRGEDVNVPIREKSEERIEPRTAIIREALKLAEAPAENDDEWELRIRLMLRYATEYVSQKLGFQSFKEARAYVQMTAQMKAHNTNRPKQQPPANQSAFNF